MSSIALDIVLAALLVSYGFTGYRHGFVVSGLSLVGFLAGGALGMWLLPELLRRWHSVDDSVLLRTAVLVFGVFVVASLGQGIAVGVGSRLRRGLRVEPARVIDSILGAVATVLAVSVLLWFMAGAVRGGASAPVARSIGGSRVIQTIDRFVPPQTARLFAGFRSVLDREGFPRVFEGVATEPIAPVAPPDGRALGGHAGPAAAGGGGPNGRRRGGGPAGRRCCRRRPGPPLRPRHRGRRSRWSCPMPRRHAEGRLRYGRQARRLRPR